MLAVETFELVFRVVHIVFAVAWAGSAFLFTLFIEPTAHALGPPRSSPPSPRWP